MWRPAAQSAASAFPTPCSGAAASPLLAKTVRSVGLLLTVKPGLEDQWCWHCHRGQTLFMALHLCVDSTSKPSSYLNMKCLEA